MHHLIFALAFLMAVPAVAGAHHQEPTAFTVEEAVALTLRNNPRLQVAERAVTATAFGVRAAQALTNPNVLFAPGITSISGTGEEFLAQQPLEINGTRQARVAIAQADLVGARGQARILIGDTIYQVKVAYYALARAQARTQIAQELLTIAQEADRVARKQVEEGARAGIDLAQTGIEVSRAERDVLLAEGAIREATATLNTLLSRPAEAPLPTLDLPESTAPIAKPTSTERGEMQVAVAQHERYQAEARLARAEGRPDLAPQFRIGYITRGLEPAREGNGAGIGIAITLPLLDYGSRKNRIRQAEEQARAQEARITATQNDIAQEIALAKARVATAESVLASYRAGVLERAKRLLEASQIGFREGRVTVVALLEAQHSYIGVRNEYSEALAESATAHARLERALGIVPQH